MKIQALKCKKCGDIIFSRSRHDFRYCSCGAIFVDGGFDYFRYGGDFADMESVKILVDATKDDLYQDWSRGINKYGLRKTNKKVKKNVAKNTKNTKSSNKNKKKTTANKRATYKSGCVAVRKVSTRISK